MKTPKVDDFPDVNPTFNTVAKLASLIPQNKNHKLFMDNLFSSIQIFYELYARGILCMGTVRSNRLSGLTMIDDKSLKAMGKSSFIEYEGRLNTNDGTVRVIRWFDNNICTLLSTMGSAQPITTIDRWDSSVSTVDKVPVSCPAVVKHYNCHMGGVDKVDSLVGIYRMFFKSRKWYHRIMFQLIDVAISNAWLLYRRDTMLLFPEKTIYMSLYDFKLLLSDCLRMQNKPICLKKVGRPAINIDLRHSQKKRRGAIQERFQLNQSGRTRLVIFLLM